MHHTLTSYFLSVLILGGACSSNTSSDSPSTAQPGQSTTIDADQGIVARAVPKPTQVGPAGSPGSSGDASDEGWVRPGQVFIDGWFASHVVSGRFTSASEFSESTWGLRIEPDGYAVEGFTVYGFQSDGVVALALPALGTTQCSLTDESLLGTSNANTIVEVAVPWGVTQMIDATGAPHPLLASNVGWNEPPAPAGSETGEQVLLLLETFGFPQLGKGDGPRQIRYILRAAFKVVDGVVNQEDGTTLTLAEIAATAEARMTKDRQEYDAKLACTKHPEKYPTWPGYSDPSCRRTDCDVPVEEVENP